PGRAKGFGAFEALASRGHRLKGLSPFQGWKDISPTYQGFAPLANHCRPSRAPIWTWACRTTCLVYRDHGVVADGLAIAGDGYFQGVALFHEERGRSIEADLDRALLAGDVQRLATLHLPVAVQLVFLAADLQRDLVDPVVIDR